MTHEPYFRPPGLGPDCSTPRSGRLRERRFAMGYEQRQQPPDYTRLAHEARDLFLAHEADGPAKARAHALSYVVEHCGLTLEPDTLFLGGEDPFFFNLLLPALEADRHQRERNLAPDEASARLRDAGMYYASCFEGHITPGLEFVLGQGISGLRQRAEEELANRQRAGSLTPDQDDFYQALLLSCQSVLRYAERYRVRALALAEQTEDPAWAADLRQAAAWLERVPEHPAETFAEALQSYWVVYVLVTLEMGGCCPGGGLGLGRPDQFLYPYYRRDLEAGRLTREQALELMELFLLGFRHVDYHTGHQQFTPGSQGSLGGVTPLGDDACNDLTELILEASLRIAMPAPYLSLRLHKGASERAWEAYANYVAGGLGFPVVNDEVLIPAFLRHGRALYDARDYICSCCYENTIPGREAFHPNGCYLNLPFVLELALNESRSQLTGDMLGAGTPPPEAMPDFSALLSAFRAQLHHVADELVALVNAADERHCAYRRYPLMSLLMEDCIARGLDVCAGGARYNLTGCIVAGLPNVVNSLAAIRELVFEQGSLALAEVVSALRDDFAGQEDLRRRLLAAPKWGNGDDRVDDLATFVTEALYEEFRHRVNARGGRWQLALYSFVANHGLGQLVGASADGRRARESLTRNLNPAWGTDRQGPTGVLRSLSRIDFSKFPDGTALDLRFDPLLFQTPAGRSMLAAFLKSFVDLGVMQMQISMVDTETLLQARDHPAQYPHLMVKVAGYSARFVDLLPQEQEEVIGRTAQRL
jgi:pyruvate-formate lyase